LSKSVLIVEDEPFIVEALSFLLEREGIHFDCSTDGAGCLDIIESNRPDLVILDMMLPQVNGMEVLQSLRQHEAFKTLPVLMLTAKGQKKDRKAAEDAGVSLFMTKPFANDELIANVHRLLDG
jgi:DNA-binding response OmpR family regulator